MAVLGAMCSGSEAEAERRRPSRRGDSPPCLTVPLVAPGTSASSRSISNEGVTEQTITWIENDLDRSRTQQSMTFPGSYLDVDTTIEYEIVRTGDAALLAMRDLHTRSTSRFGTAEKLNLAETSFAPSLVLRPIALCAGQAWTINPTLAVTTTTQDGHTTTSSTSTPPLAGDVVDWRATIEVPAGRFETVRWDGVGVVNGGVFRTSTWTSTEYGMAVKQEVFGPDGALIQTTEMTTFLSPRDPGKSARNLTALIPGPYPRRR